MRQTFPHAKVFVRAFDRAHAVKLMDDADIHIVREVYDASIALAKTGLMALGDDRDSVENIIAEFRTRDAMRLQMQHETGDMHAGMELTFGAIKS